MGKYLITGLSGTGKSTLAEELTRRGLKALDTDKDLGLNKWFGIDTGQIVDYQPPVSPDWYNKHQFGWDKQEFERVLSGSQKDDIFICGSSYNDSEFYDLFDKVFFLVVDEQTLVHRLRNRAGKSFGKEPAELSEILKWHRLIDYKEPAAKHRGSLIDATLPVSQSVSKILAEIHDHSAVA